MCPTRLRGFRPNCGFTANHQGCYPPAAASTRRSIPPDSVAFNDGFVVWERSPSTLSVSSRFIRVNTTAAVDRDDDGRCGGGDGGRGRSDDRVGGRFIGG